MYTFFLGVITSFSLPPYNYFIINFFTLSLFFIFIINQKKFSTKNIEYFKYGWFFGLGFFITSLYWITFALTFDKTFKILIPISLILIPSFLAIFYGLAVYGLSFFKSKNNFYLLLIFSLLLGVIEFIRGTILTGFPWNLLAFSFSEKIKFIQILSLVGTYSFNLFCITFFLIPSIFLLKKTRSDILLSFAFLIVAISFFIFGVQELNKGNTSEKKINNYLIKIISPKLDINRFYSSSGEEKIVKDLIRLSKPEQNIPTIFIWPEGVLTSTNLINIKKYKKFFDKSFSEKHLIVLGINDLIYLDGESKIYNSLVVLDNNLNIKNLYYKNNLVPFGEFLPFENNLVKFGFRSITHGYKSFSKGEARDIFKLKNEYFNLSFLPLICYEIIYSGKISKKNNFDFIINISEDGLFGDSIGPHQHFSHSIFRAIEEGKNIVRSSNNGVSALIDPYGRVLNKIESTQSGVIEVKQFEIVKETFFSKKGNNIFFYFLLFYISLIFFLKKKGS